MNTPKKDRAAQQLAPIYVQQVAPVRLFLTRREAAEACGGSVATHRAGQGLRALKAKKTAERGGRELYRIEDLHAWFAGLDDA